MNPSSPPNFETGRVFGCFRMTWLWFCWWRLVDVGVGFLLEDGFTGVWHSIVSDEMCWWVRLVLDPNLSGRWCQMDSQIDEECANEAYSLYVSENPQSQSKKTATTLPLFHPYLTFAHPEVRPEVRFVHLVRLESAGGPFCGRFVHLRH